MSDNADQIVDLPPMGVVLLAEPGRVEGLQRWAQGEAALMAANGLVTDDPQARASLVDDLVSAALTDLDPVLVWRMMLVPGPGQHNMVLRVGFVQPEGTEEEAFARLTETTGTNPLETQVSTFAFGDVRGQHAMHFSFRDARTGQAQPEGVLWTNFAVACRRQLPMFGETDVVARLTTPFLDQLSDMVPNIYGLLAGELLADLVAQSVGG
ncbi:MAG TPA: hypothetical protein PLO87_04315 [Ornithinibacter sp.]|nr:hypothetical protein [Ornithinibacter sp.]HQD67796.1 hypothetical protein [Ornithinibacter sp.]